MKHLLISRAFRRTGASLISLLPFLFLFITIFACNRMGEGKTSEDEEVRLFSLVADPSAEGDYATAIRRADSLLEGVAMGDTLKGYIMLERNTALGNSGNIVGALTYTDTVLDFARSHGLVEVEIQVLQNRGVAFRRIERYDSAVNCYSRSIDLASAIGDIELMQSGSELLAIAYADMNRLEEAEDFGRKALDFATQMEDQDAMTASMSTLATTLAKANKNIEAIEMAKPLLELQEVNPLNRMKLLTPLAYAANNLDSVRLMTEVVGEMKKVADVFPESHQVKRVWLSSESSLAAMKGDYRKQWEILCRLDSMPSQGKSVIEIDLEKAKCLGHLGRYNEAYDVLQKVATQYEDSRQAQIQREMSEYFVKYQTLLKELKIVRLQNQRLILAIALGSCIVVIFGGWLLWIHISRVRREREFHKAQMEFIRGLEHERGRVARELHDDVAGDLVGLQYDVLTGSPEESSEKIAAVAGKVRRLSHDMMPPEFEEYDLPRLLEDLAVTTNAAGRVEVKIRLEGSYDWHALDAMSNLNLYRP
ncbi:MAG: hypothetical protein K2L34_15195, partial [Muribaculaceae bacterium]|nr:hypothetical protein [Muribaculaceae bacterium]